MCVIALTYYRCWSDLFFVFLLAWTDAKWTPPSRFYPDSSHLPIVSFDDGPCVVSSRSISCLADVRLVFIRLLYNTLASTTRIPPPKDKWKGWMAIEIERKHDDWRFIQPSAHQAVCYVNSSRLTHSLFFSFLVWYNEQLGGPSCFVWCRKYGVVKWCDPQKGGGCTNVNNTPLRLITVITCLAVSVIAITLLKWRENWPTGHDSNIDSFDWILRDFCWNICFAGHSCELTICRIFYFLLSLVCYFFLLNNLQHNWNCRRNTSSGLFITAAWSFVWFSYNPSPFFVFVYNKSLRIFYFTSLHRWRHSRRRKNRNRPCTLIRFPLFTSSLCYTGLFVSNCLRRRQTHTHTVTKKENVQTKMWFVYSANVLVHLLVCLPTFCLLYLFTVIPAVQFSFFETHDFVFCSYKYTYWM